MLFYALVCFAFFVFAISAAYLLNIFIIKKGRVELSAGRKKFDKHNNFFVRLFWKDDLRDGKRRLREGAQQIRLAEIAYNFLVIVGICFFLAFLFFAYNMLGR